MAVTLASAPPTLLGSGDVFHLLLGMALALDDR